MKKRFLLTLMVVFCLTSLFAASKKSNINYEQFICDFNDFLENSEDILSDLKYYETEELLTYIHCSLEMNVEKDISVGEDFKVFAGSAAQVFINGNNINIYFDIRAKINGERVNCTAKINSNSLSVKAQIGRVNYNLINIQQFIRDLEYTFDDTDFENIDFIEGSLSVNEMSFNIDTFDYSLDYNCGFELYCNASEENVYIELSSDMDLYLWTEDYCAELNLDNIDLCLDSEELENNPLSLIDSTDFDFSFTVTDENLTRFYNQEFIESFMENQILDLI